MTNSDTPDLATFQSWIGVLPRSGNEPIFVRTPDGQTLPIADVVVTPTRDGRRIEILCVAA